MKKTVYKTVFLLFCLITICNLSPLIAQDYVNLIITTPEGIDWDIDAIKADNDHGPQLTAPLSGEIVKAFDDVTAPTDNDTWSEFGAYCCDSIINPDDLTGKIAYISRGACSFSLKIWNAEKAGAIGVIIANRAPIGLQTGTHDPGLIIMSATAPESDSLTIPAIFISHEDRIELEQMLDAGPPVMGTFDVPIIYDLAGPQAYSTPIDQVQPLDIKFSTFTRTGDTLYNVDFTVEILDPNGDSQFFTKSVDTLLAGKDWIAGTVNEPLIEFDDVYTPSMVGGYLMTVSAATEQGDLPLDAATAGMLFIVSEHTFALDNDFVTDVNGMQINSTSLIENGGVFDVGSLYRIGGDGGTVTYGSFAIGNPGALDVGLGYEFTLKIYNADADGDGLVDLDFTEELASKVYSLNGTEVPNELIDVGFDDPVELDSGIYCLMVEAGGFNFSDQAVAWSTAGGDAYPSHNTVYRFGTALEIAGFEYWNGTPATGPPTYALAGRHPVVRMQMDGYEPIVGLKVLPESNVNIYPTLANNEVKIDFRLENLSKKVLLVATDLNGKILYYEKMENVKNQNFSFDVSNFPTGTYFFTIRADESAVTKKIIVVR